MPAPNILLIITDQQHSRMMSCAGNPYLKTPAMDGLAERGVLFDRAYCTNPVCVPSRFSLMTGRYPSAIGQRANPSRHLPDIPDEIVHNGLGWLMQRAGYETVYGGKEHLPKMNSQDLGFDYIEKDERDQLAETCSAYLSETHARPFCMVASFINPHDICLMAIRDSQQDEMEKRLVEVCTREIEELDIALQPPAGVSMDEFYAEHCPPLPPNFAPQKDEPEALTAFAKQRPFKYKARTEWTDERWRLHRWAYARLTERVDGQIGRVLDALAGGPHADNTLVIFTSDHGDNDGAHKFEHKTLLYDEPCRIPFIVAGPGVEPAGHVNTGHIVSNGLDILPTACDYAGIEAPEGLEGRSLRPLLEGDKEVPWRDYLKVETEIGCGIVSDRFLYARYDEGANAEQLYDLESNPYQMWNDAGKPENEDVLAQHRAWHDGALSY